MKNPIVYDAFHPGKPWLDTEGKRIHAHGGSILYHEGFYYWYGENKEKSTPGSGIWHWGVRCYRSLDLYNWEDLGLICPPNTTDKNNPLHYTQYMDRPHILHNKKTRKFVMWVKIMDNQNLNHQYMVVLTSDSIIGPYTVVNTFMPLGMNSGDFDLVADETDGKGYIYFDRVHSEMICADLTEDYCNVTGYYSTHLPQPYTPLVREAPAFFTRNYKKYLLTSGTTGYYPNATEAVISACYHGPWTPLKNPHIKDTYCTSFMSQISSIFKHPKKKDLYIALADRWLTQLPHNLNYFDILNGLTHPDIAKKVMTEEEFAPIQEISSPEKRDTSLADYVWLPIRFAGDQPYIEWRDSWKIEEFE